MINYLVKWEEVKLFFSTK